MKNKFLRDKLHRTIIRAKLFFTADEKKHKDLFITYALWSPEGRKTLFEAMVDPIRKVMYY